MRLLLPLLALLAPVAAQAAETRCGWFHNPTPSNAWLVDSDGEWLIASQGGLVPAAEGDWPRTGEWVGTNAGSYGYGCSCARVETDPAERRVIRIISSKPRTLAQCRADPALRGKEPAE